MLGALNLFVFCFFFCAWSLKLNFQGRLRQDRGQAVPSQCLGSLRAAGISGRPSPPAH